MTVILTGRVRDAPLDVPVIVSVAFVGGAEPPPHPPTSTHVATQAHISAAGTAMRIARLFAAFVCSNKINISPASASVPNANGDRCIPGTSPNGMTMTLEVFDTLTTNAAPLAPLTPTEEGDTEQVDDIGCPVQLRATVPVNPLFGVICRLYVAVCPALMVAAVEQLLPLEQLAPVAAASEKSVPVPTNPKLCGLAGASSVTVTEAILLPAAAGVKIRLMVQLALAASVTLLAGQLFVCAKSALFVPMIPMLEMASGALPMFVSVTAFAELLVVISWPPASRLF